MKRASILMRYMKNLFFTRDWQVGVNVGNYEIGFDFQPTVNVVMAALKIAKNIEKTLNVPAKLYLLVAMQAVVVSAFDTGSTDCFQLKNTSTIANTSLVEIASDGKLLLGQRVLSELTEAVLCNAALPLIKTVCMGGASWRKDVYHLFLRFANESSPLYSPTLAIAEKACEFEMILFKRQQIGFFQWLGNMGIWTFATASAVTHATFHPQTRMDVRMPYWRMSYLFTVVLSSVMALGSSINRTDNLGEALSDAEVARAVQYAKSPLEGHLYLVGIMTAGSNLLEWYYDREPADNEVQQDEDLGRNGPPALA